jgi:hypothetical protein
MICDVSYSDEGPRESGPHWWARPSPWLWGLLILLAIAATQAPRIASMLSGVTSKPRTEAPARPRPAASAVAPALSGPDYTQAMVAGRDFIGADLHGARLAHLDLRGQNFRGADVAGVIFAGSLLNGVNLSHADLRGADLRYSCLRGAKLTGTDLAGADFTGADITGTIVRPRQVAKAIGWASGESPSPCLRSSA